MKEMMIHWLETKIIINNKLMDKDGYENGFTRFLASDNEMMTRIIEELNKSSDEQPQNYCNYKTGKPRKSGGNT